MWAYRPALFPARRVDKRQECENYRAKEHSYAQNPVKNDVGNKRICKQIHSRGYKRKVKHEFRKVISRAFERAEIDVHNRYRHHTAKPKHYAKRPTNPDDVKDAKLLKNQSDEDDANRAKLDKREDKGRAARPLKLSEKVDSKICRKRNRKQKVKQMPTDAKRRKHKHAKHRAKRRNNDVEYVISVGSHPLLFSSNIILPAFLNKVKKTLSKIKIFHILINC